MAHNDFSGEAPFNYAQKCLCVLVLDVSGSMGGAPITELNKGLQDFYKEIEDDPKMSQQLEVSIITFNKKPATVQVPALVQNFKMPALRANGSTAMVDAVRDAITMVADRKAWYKQEGQTYYRPWIILMTDGEPDPGQDVAGLAGTIDNDARNKRYSFLPIGVQGANMDILNQLAGSHSKALPLKGTNFSSFFRWLSASIGGAINNAEGGGTADSATKPDTTWIEDIFFTI
jgi:uncharacterized protein YegL